MAGGDDFHPQTCALCQVSDCADCRGCFCGSWALLVGLTQQYGLACAVSVYALVRHLVLTSFEMAVQGVRDNPMKLRTLGYSVPLVGIAISDLAVMAHSGRPDLVILRSMNWATKAWPLWRKIIPFRTRWCRGVCWDFAGRAGRRTVCK